MVQPYKPFQSQGHIKNCPIVVASLIIIACLVVEIIQCWFFSFVNSLWPCIKVKVIKMSMSIYPMHKVSFMNRYISTPVPVTLTKYWLQNEKSPSGKCVSQNQHHQKTTKVNRFRYSSKEASATDQIQWNLFKFKTKVAGNIKISSLQNVVLNYKERAAGIFQSLCLKQKFVWKRIVI